MPPSGASSFRDKETNSSRVGFVGAPQDHAFAVGELDATNITSSPWFGQLRREPS